MVKRSNMPEEMGLTETAKSRKHFLYVGPPILLVSLATSLTDTVLTDLMVYRTCLVTLDINDTECAMLRHHNGSPKALNLETKVEPHASVIVMSNTLIQCILPAISCSILGPWSDRGGRRPLFLAAISGSALMCVMLSFMSIWNISPWYLLLATIPAYIVGGPDIVRLAFTCHISDTTADKSRILHLAFLEASVCGGNVLGGLAGPLIYNNYGYTIVFSTAAVCCVVALVYSYFYINETVKNTSKGSIRGIFHLSSVKEFVASVLVKREGFHRPIVWLSIFSLMLVALAYTGEQTIKFLFTRARMGWDVQHYSHYDAAESVLFIAGLSAVSIIKRFLGPSETLMASISFVSAIGTSIAQTLAWQTWHMYLSSFIGMFGGIVYPALRTLISKFVPAEDIGKVFSFTLLLEMLISSAGPTLYTLVYTNYLPPIYPTPVFLISLSFHLVGLICVMCIEIPIRNRRMHSHYVPAAQEDLPP